MDAFATADHWHCKRRCCAKQPISRFFTLEPNQWQKGPSTPEMGQMTCLHRFENYRLVFRSALADFPREKRAPCQC